MKKLIFWLIILGVGAYYGSLHSGEVSLIVEKVKPIVEKGVELSKKLSGEVAENNLSDNLGGVSGFGRIEYQDYGRIAESVIKLSLSAGTSTASWYNNTGDTVYVSWASLRTDGIASSSFGVYVGTSTLSALATYTTPDKSGRSIIDGWNVATGTAATSTSNIYRHDALQDVVAAIPANSYMVVSLFSGSRLAGTFAHNNGCVGPAANGGNSATANNCEAATSTNRGFNLELRAKVNN